MNDPKAEKKATEWSDDIPDPDEEERLEPYEETYHDMRSRGRRLFLADMRPG